MEMISEIKQVSKPQEEEREQKPELVKKDARGLEALLDYLQVHNPQILHSDNYVIIPLDMPAEEWQSKIKSAGDVVDFIEINGKKYPAAYAWEDFPYPEAVDADTKAFAYTVNEFGSMLLPLLGNKPLIVSEAERRYNKMRAAGLSDEDAKYRIWLYMAAEGIVTPKRSNDLEIIAQGKDYIYLRLPHAPDSDFARSYIGAKVIFRTKDPLSTITGKIESVTKLDGCYAAKAKVNTQFKKDVKGMKVRVNGFENGRRMWFTKDVDAFEYELRKIAKGQDVYSEYHDAIGIEGFLDESMPYTSISLGKKASEITKTELIESENMLMTALMCYPESATGFECKSVSLGEKRNARYWAKGRTLQFDLLFAEKGIMFPDDVLEFWKGYKSGAFDREHYSKEKFFATRTSLFDAYNEIFSKLDKEYQQLLHEKNHGELWQRLDGILKILDEYDEFEKDEEEAIANAGSLATGNHGREYAKRKRGLTKEYREILEKYEACIERHDDELYKREAKGETIDEEDEEAPEIRHLREQSNINKNLEALEHLMILNESLYIKNNIYTEVNDFMKFYRDAKIAIAANNKEAFLHSIESGEKESPFSHEKHFVIGDVIKPDVIGISFKPQQYVSPGKKLVYGYFHGGNYILHLVRNLECLCVAPYKCCSNGRQIKLDIPVPAALDDFMYALSMKMRYGKEYAANFGA